MTDLSAPSTPLRALKYEANYGYVPATRASVGAELDAYYLGTDEPMQRAKGVCIAVVHRKDDDDDKLVVVPQGIELTMKRFSDQFTFKSSGLIAKLYAVETAAAIGEGRLVMRTSGPPGMVVEQRPAVSVGVVAFLGPKEQEHRHPSPRCKRWMMRHGM